MDSPRSWTILAMLDAEIGSLYQVHAEDRKRLQKIVGEARRLCIEEAESLRTPVAPGDEERALLDEIEVELDGLVSWSSDKHAPERAAKIRAAIRRALRSAPQGDV